MLYLEPLNCASLKTAAAFTRAARRSLFIDLKTNGEKTYAALQPVLEEYRDMITSHSPKGAEQRAIDVVITGACPRAVITAQKERLACVDGNVKDSDSDESADLVPVVSENWRVLQMARQGTDTECRKGETADVRQKSQTATWPPTAAGGPRPTTWRPGRNFTATTST